MEKIRIITDSASDFSYPIPDGVTVLPLTVRFDDTEYLDGVTISHREFFEKLIESDVLPKTSLISPGNFAEAYQEAVDDGCKVLVITVSGKLSGTYQSAVVAAQEYPGQVFVIDSQSAAIGEQILVRYALELVQKELPLEEIISKVKASREKLHVIALLDTLEYLQKGGRISKTAALVGGVLSIKPVITIREGAVAMVGKARGSRNGNNLLITEIEKASGVDFSMPVCLGYTGLSDLLLQKYIQDSSSLWEGHLDTLQIASIGATIGTHVGPNAIAVAFFSVS